MKSVVFVFEVEGQDDVDLCQSRVSEATCLSFTYLIDKMQFPSISTKGESFLSGTPNLSIRDWLGCWPYVNLTGKMEQGGGCN